MNKVVALFFLGAAVGLVSCSQDEDAIISTSSDEGKTTITIDKERLRQKTQEAADAAEKAGRRALDETGEALQKAGKALEAEGDDTPLPQEP
jgi:hypothetical protein